MKTTMKEMVTIGEVAETLGVSGDTIRRIVKRGELPAVKVGKWLRFDPCAVEAYLSVAMNVKD